MTRAALLARVLLAAYAVFLAVVLFSPTGDRQVRGVGKLGELLNLLHPPAGLVTFDRLEVLSNILLVIPLTLLATLVKPSASWRDWTTYAFVVASGVEVVQGFILPSRQATYSDVVANTAGALLGAVAGAILVRLAGSMLRARKSR